MTKYKKYLFIASIILASILIGCSMESSQEEIGLKIVGMSTSLSNEENQDFQEYQYEIWLRNDSEEEIEIEELEPLILQNIKERMEEKDISSHHNVTLKPNQEITISNSFIFNTEGLTKEEIDSYKFIHGVLAKLNTGNTILIEN